MNQRTQIMIMALAAALFCSSSVHHAIAADGNANDSVSTEAPVPETPPSPNGNAQELPIRTLTIDEMKPSYGPCPEFLYELLRRMETIKVGSTRADLQEVFDSAGGFSGRASSTYNYKESVLIHVRVEFEYDLGNPDFGTDRIVSISAPYIG